VVGESKIIVRTDHDHSLPVDHYLRILRGFELPKKEIAAAFL
jgi:hypothetical protein